MAECIINRPAGLEFITLLDEDISGTGTTEVSISPQFRIPEGTLFIIFQVVISTVSGSTPYLYAKVGTSKMPVIGKLPTTGNQPRLFTDIFMANGTDSGNTPRMKYYRYNAAVNQTTYLPINSPWQLILYDSTSSATMSITGHAKVTAIKIP